MRITPLDVRKQEFRKAVRGFDCDEVRGFLDTLADEYETVLVDNKQIREQVMEHEDKIAEYKTMERTLRDTLMTAEKLMQETKETANKEGNVIIEGAHQKAKAILQECRMRTEELRREIVGLRKEKETYLARFKGLAEAQISFIETHKNDFADLDKRLVDMMDSVIDGTIDSEAEARFNSPTPAPVSYSPAPETQTKQETFQPVSEAPPATGKSEVDMWRDYNPNNEPAQEAVAPAPVNETPAENIIPEQAPENQESQASVDPFASSDSVDNSASVDMAAMGIPIPAVPPQELDEQEDEHDDINQAVSSTFVESNQS